MNYFELYNLPISFQPDQNVVKMQFYALSKKYHPDFYANESQEKQNEVMALSTLNNKAFQVLKDKNKTLKYVLELKHLIAAGDGYQLPQSFLIEMMDVNEVLMDLQFGKNEAKLKKVEADIQQIEQNLDAELAGFTKDFENLTLEQQEQNLIKIKDIYYRGNYVLRLKDSLTKVV